ncbi:MAG: acetyl-CoA carboxylase biotin carboxyl carrier protein subunit [Bacteroidales bacterium]|nr:acetyl-CoA carboxylase biotin carboxyl carrier protein subunit [Bacteroidales bacterium]
MEVRINSKPYELKVLNRNNNVITVSINGKKYELDIEQVANGVYSVLHNGMSFNIELINGSSAKKYTVNTFYRSYDVEIADAQTRYMESRKGGGSLDENKVITSPMPGKVVAVPVKLGETVQAGQTMIVISAMKMESEYKAGCQGIVKEINVKEGDTIEANKPLVVIE